MKKINKFLSVVLSILMIMSIIPLTVSAATYSGACGENITWEFEDETGILTISGTGDMSNYKGYYTPWESFKDNVKEVSISYGVTKIGNCAFFSYTNLENVSIPNSVTTIGTSAFNGCSNLTNIVIPDSVTSISDGAFYCCSSLTSVSIPSSVMTIGNSAFYSCTNLANITIPDSVTLVGIYAFEYTAFYNNEANWENDVLYIGNHLFAAKSTVSGDYVIKNGTKTIADSAFSGCTSLTGVSIPNSVATIGESAFLGCYNLKNLTIPNSVTLIDDKAFNACEKIASISVDSNNQNYTSIDGVLYNKDKTVLIKYPEGDKTRTEYIIPDTVLTVKEWAFRYCSTLNKITVPDSVIAIEDNAFYYCLNLTNIIIGENVATIGECAFDECSTLKTVYYTGTSAQWNKIAIDDSNTYLLNAIIHYDSNAGDFAYSVISETDKTIMITGYNVSGPVKEIKIPSTIDGYTVVEIDEYVFKDIDTLTDLQLPNTLKTIGKYAFSDCDSLKNVIIPNSVTSIGLRAFYSCSSLETVTFGISLESIGNKAFYQCKKMTDIYYTGTEAQWNEISIGTDNFAINDATKHFEFKLEDETDESITGVCGDNLTWTLNVNTGELTISGTGAMYDYEIDDVSGFINQPWYNFSRDIKHIVVEDGVTSIGEAAFTSCDATDITIGKDVASIGSEALDHCDELTNIIVDEDNPYYSNDEFGVLFNKDKTTLIYYPLGSQRESYTIPDGVTTIKRYAFDDCGKVLKSVTVPKSVTTIEKLAFSQYSALTSFVISYLGTETEWNAIDGSDDISFWIGVNFAEQEHKHNYKSVITAPTCTEQGYTTYTCECGETYVDDYVNATGHADNDGNGYCDACNELLDPTVECNCNCHSSGITKFFFNFILFFQRIFGFNKDCDCGVTHY